MSKKNISKTIIEGGRHPSNKQKRRLSNVIVRRSNKKFIASSHNDPDYFDNDLNFENRHKVYKNHDDKLGAVFRWLNSRLGKSWNKTYSLLKEKFDVSTTAGRHVIYDHILREIWTSQSPMPNNDYITNYIRYKYYVDKYGLLRKTVSKFYDHQAYLEEIKKINQWLNKRLIHKVGNTLFWYQPTKKLKLIGDFDFIYKKYQMSNMYLEYPRWIQSDPVRGKDLEFYYALSDSYKESLEMGFTLQGPYND